MRVNVNIPDELYKEAKAIAESQHVTIDDVISSAFAEHLAAWDRLKQKAARDSREAFLGILAKVPDVEPEDHDRISYGPKT